MKHRLEVSFPPSVNHRFSPAVEGRRLILENNARKWLRAAGFDILVYCRQNGIEPISEYTFFDLWWFVPNKRCDAHNSEKALFDAFQRGGLVKADKFVLNRTQGGNVDAADPRVIVEFETKSAAPCSP